MSLHRLTSSRFLASVPSQRQRILSAVVRCSSSDAKDSGNTPSSSGKPSGFKGFGKEPEPRPSTADALMQSLGGLSDAAGRVSSSNNYVLGTDDSVEKWRELDNQVNEYPGQRTFKAIGSGGDDFVASMTRCVEAVVGTVHTECVNQRLSSQGKYISVTVGPVWVETPEQVLEIFRLMKEDGRMKFYL